jgi:hypothetical protein
LGEATARYGEEAGGESDDGCEGVGTGWREWMIWEGAESGLRWESAFGVWHADGSSDFVGFGGEVEEVGRIEVDIVIELEPNFAVGREEFCEGAGSGAADEGVFADGVPANWEVIGDDVGDSVYVTGESIGFDIAVSEERYIGGRYAHEKSSDVGGRR